MSQSFRRELAKIFSVPEGDGRHQALEEFVAGRPNYGEGHLYLGLSYMLNRFSATLALPMSVLVLGGRHLPTHAPPETVSEHLEKAEEHFNLAKELDPALTGPATANLASLKLMRQHYQEAIVYIEGLMKEGNRSEEPVLRQHLGTAYRELGECDIALELFLSLVDCELTLVHRNLALTYLCKDDLNKAEEEQREQLRRTDSELDALFARGIAAELRGDAGEARSAYEAIASACRFDGQNQLLGVNAARRQVKLARHER